MYSDNDDNEDDGNEPRNYAIAVHRPSIQNLEEAQLQILENDEQSHNQNRESSSRLQTPLHTTDEEEIEEKIEELEDNEEVIVATTVSPVALNAPEETPFPEAECSTESRQSRSSPGNDYAPDNHFSNRSSLPLVEIPRRLSLQVNSSGRPIVPVSDVGTTEINLLALNPLWGAIPRDGYRTTNKLPGGSRYFVSPVDDPSKRTPSASPSVNIFDPLPLNPPPPFPWHEERISSSSHSQRPLGSAQSRQSRPVTTSRNRPVSTTGGQPRRTEVRRNSSPRCTWSPPILNNADVFHLPPGGPDCHPGCGYSGLPCYVCSTKGMQSVNVENSERRARSSIFSILHRYDSPVRHRSTGQQTLTNGEESSFTERVMKPCFYGLYSCAKGLKERIHLPQSRVKQLGLTFFIMYVLLILHIGITRILRDYRF